MVDHKSTKRDGGLSLIFSFIGILYEFSDAVSDCGQFNFDDGQLIFNAGQLPGNFPKLSVYGIEFGIKSAIGAPICRPYACSDSYKKPNNEQESDEQDYHPPLQPSGFGVQFAEGVGSLNSIGAMFRSVYGCFPCYHGDIIAWSLGSCRVETCCDYDSFFFAFADLPCSFLKHLSGMDFIPLFW